MAINIIDLIPTQTRIVEQKTGCATLPMVFFFQQLTDLNKQLQDELIKLSNRIDQLEANQP